MNRAPSSQDGYGLLGAIHTCSLRSTVEGYAEYDEKDLGRARKLRKEMTLPEVLLWQTLRTRPRGLKFRRQQAAGPYVLDFYCDAAHLAIEVDGLAHDMGHHPQRDIERDRWLEKAGIRTLRISASEILQDVEPVVTAIVEACRTTPTPPPACGWSPSPSGRI